MVRLDKVLSRLPSCQKAFLSCNGRRTGVVRMPMIAIQMKLQVLGSSKMAPLSMTWALWGYLGPGAWVTARSHGVYSVIRWQ